MYYLFVAILSFGILRVSYDFAPEIIKDMDGQPIWYVTLKIFYYLGGALFFAGFLSAIIGFGEFYNLQTFIIFFLVAVAAGTCGIYAGYKHKLK